jgi:hypothetical protein
MRADDFPELDPFGRILLEDFEYATSRGGRPRPVCSTTLDWRTGRVERRWLWNESPPPIDVRPDDLYVSFHLPAELVPRRVLGWPQPTNAIDLCVERKRLVNGRVDDRGEPLGRSLVATLVDHDIDVAQFADKKEMQLLAAGGGPYTEQQRRDLLAYNEQDVRALEQLFPRMLPHIDLPRALLRGRYMTEVARIEYNGMPVNRQELQILADNWEGIKDALIRETDQPFGVYEGRTFKEKRWVQWVKDHELSWSYLASGRPALDRNTFKKMAERYPEIEPIRDLRGLLSQLKFFDLPVGDDGRTRCDVYTFSTITGRNAPDASDFIFAWPKWCRGLIQPPPGRALINLDYAQEEYLITGTLSGDARLIDDYRRGDVYVSLGKSLGLIPPWGDDKTHRKERDLCKVIVLATNYGMGAKSLAEKIGCTVSRAAYLLRRHHETYARFWRWSDATVDYARLYRRLWTKYGWSVHVEPDTGDPTWRNWRVQATGGEVLRVAVCALGGAGFQIDATVHDSILIEVDVGDADDAAREAERIMVAASVAVLGEPLRVDATIVRPGGRLLESGKPTATWQKVWRLIRDLGKVEVEV